MAVASAPPPAAEPRPRPVAGVAGVGVFAVVVVLALSWAKWDPYGHKIAHLWSARAWSGAAVLDAGQRPTDAPSLAAGWRFTEAYGKAVWMALVAALLIAATAEALVPRRWLLTVLTRRTALGGSLAGGLLAVPFMMCTCCTAPVAATLRRNGVPAGAALAYWVGNPTLNPAVLVFLALVAPWQWVATRVLVGVLLVVGVTAVVGRLAPRRAPDAVVPVPVEDDGLADAPRRFVRTLARLALVLVPEYFVVVFAVGAFRGWLFPLDGHAAHGGVPATLLAAVLGTLVVIPTAGEIPVLQGLGTLGVGAGPLGALLIALPALSLPSMVMVGRAFSWRVTGAMAAAVAATSLLAAIVLVLLTRA